MKRSKFTEQLIAFALQQAESGTQVAEVCRKMGISEATFLIAIRGEEVTAARGAAPPSGRRSHTRQRDAAGGDPPQTMTPARGRATLCVLRSGCRSAELAEPFRH
jgi:putative transposase